MTSTKRPAQMFAESLSSFFSASLMLSENTIGTVISPIKRYTASRIPKNTISIILDSHSYMNGNIKSLLFPFKTLLCSFSYPLLYPVVEDLFDFILILFL